MKDSIMSTDKTFFVFIKKITAVLLSAIVFLSIAGITANAAEEYLTTLLIIPDKSITYTNYDSAFLKIMNTGTGEVKNFTLYPYNNFSNKVLLEEGEYLVLDAGINGRNDIIVGSNTEKVMVNGNKAIIINLSDTGIIATTKPTTTITTTTVSTTTTTTTTYVPSSTSITAPTIDFSTQEHTGESVAGDNNTNPSSSILNPYLTTTQNNQETPEQDSNKEFKDGYIIFIILLILTIICILFFILLHKKNKTDQTE